MNITAKHRCGFTVIEFVLALVILGFIVAILVGTYGKTAMDAHDEALTIRIVEDLDDIKRAIQELIGNTGSDADSYMPGSYTKDKFPSLKAWPTPPPLAGFDTGGVNGDFVYNYWTPSSAINLDNSAAADSMLVLGGVTEGVCKQFNTKFSKNHHDGSIPFGINISDGNVCTNIGNIYLGATVPAYFILYAVMLY